MKHTQETKIIIQTQKQRWLKYGVNVGVSIVLVIALATLLTWTAQMQRKRLDMTAGGLYSLKPQTLNIIRGIKTPVKIISLYHKTDVSGAPNEQAQIVSDLLEEYRTKGKGIEIESIDPVREKDKQEDLYNDLV